MTDEIADISEENDYNKPEEKCQERFGG